MTISDSIGLCNILEKLDSSEADPKLLTSRNYEYPIKESICLLGELASRWRETPTLEQITLLSKRGIHFKFLLFDPQSPKEDEFIIKRAKKPSFNVFNELIEALGNNVEIRLLQVVPAFRMAILDKRVVYLYDYNDHNEKYNYTNNTPVIKLEMLKDESHLGLAFYNLYETLWESAKKY